MLLDQIQRGRIPADARVFDAGCGGGRNLHWFVQAGHTVGGCDADPDAAAATRHHLGLSETVIEWADSEHCSAPAASWDLVICNAVLHFRPDAEAAATTLAAAWRLVAAGGLLFVRLATTIGLPPGTTLPGFTFVADLDWILHQTDRLEADLADPVKTSNVQNRRCMTTWVLRRRT